MDKNTYCASFWNHQMIDTTGRVKPCCRFVEDPGSSFNIMDTDIKEIFYSNYMQDLRNMSKSGVEIRGCQRCYEEQNNNKKSLRQRINENHATNMVDLDDPSINYLELAISNDCNLMCRICSSRYSQKLYQEELEYFGKAHVPSRYTRSNIDAAYDLLPDLKYIKFTGGEPLIIKEHWELLECAVSKGYASSMTLNYSTNCTIWPKAKHVQLWKNFKRIEMALSVDSVVAAENEYQRHLTDHAAVLKNVRRYKDLSACLPMLVSCRPTISIYNIYHLPETLEWLHDMDIKVNPTHLTYPQCLSITVLPPEQKNVISNKFKNYSYKRPIDRQLSYYLLDYMHSKDSSDLMPQFARYTRYLDQRRTQDFTKVCWYFGDLLNSFKGDS